jgi:ribosome maturation factor RimP
LCVRRFLWHCPRSGREILWNCAGGVFLQKNNKIEQKVEEMVSVLLYGTNIELSDVEYINEEGWHLRVLLDKPSGIEIDDCRMVSERLSELLDAEDIIKTHYYLEVSSPGIDRKLRKEGDFAKYAGKPVDVKIKNRKNPITGCLANWPAEFIEIVSDGQSVKIERDKIVSIRLHVDF